MRHHTLQKKKVLLISFEYPSGKNYCGGVGHVVEKCRETLRGMGHDVYVLISGKFLKKFPVTVVCPDGSLKKYATFQRFQRECSLIDFDYIIQHFVNWAAELKKIKQHKEQRPKIIYHFHSILRREKDSGFKTLNRFLLNQEKMIDLADSIICPSRYEYNNFLRYFPDFRDKVVLIENTVDILPINQDKIEEIKKSYQLNCRDIVSLYVGRIELIKGAHTLIRYLPYLLKRHRQLKVFIIGKTLEARLYRKLKIILQHFPRQVFYIKYVDKHTLCQYYYLSDIYVNPSLSESFSLSTHEAALCGNAMLLTDLPVFEKFKNAAQFFSDYTDDGKEFVAQFDRLIAHERLRTTLAKKAKHTTERMLRNGNLKRSLNKLLR